MSSICDARLKAMSKIAGYLKFNENDSGIIFEHDICWIVEPGEVTEDPSSVQITLHKFLCDYLLQQSRLIKTGE